MDTIGYMITSGMEHSPIGVRANQAADARALSEAIFLRDSFHGDFSRENMIRCYNDHIEEVKRTCPPQKLFIFRVRKLAGPLTLSLRLLLFLLSPSNLPFTNHRRWKMVGDHCVHFLANLFLMYLILTSMIRKAFKI